MKILFIGDISGRPGREIVKQALPEIVKSESIDLVIGNAENVSGGRGIRLESIYELQSYGIDLFTAGEHFWSYKDLLKQPELKNLPIARPYNYEKQSELPGLGFIIHPLKFGNKLALATLLGQNFMRDIPRNPFWAVDDLLTELYNNDVSSDKDIIIIDFHAEATAEKVALAYYLHDKVTAVIGTHTHVATADCRLIGNTAFVSDVGMAGPRDASLWADFDNVIHNFKFPFKKAMKMQYEGQRIFNSVVIEIKNTTVQSIKRVDRVLNS